MAPTDLAKDISLDTLRWLVRYEQDTGVFYWNAKRRRCRSGDVVGTRGNTRCFIVLLGKMYQAHRLAWLYIYGRWPSGGLDHINGNPLDNRIANLREASQGQNLANARKRKVKTTSQYKGVDFRPDMRKKWRARIRVNNQEIMLGFFDTEESAFMAYSAACREHYGEFANPTGTFKENEYASL